VNPLRVIQEREFQRIDNQNLDDLQKYAGQNVTLTGKLTGESIEVSSIVAK